MIAAAIGLIKWSALADRLREMYLDVAADDAPSLKDAHRQFRFSRKVGWGLAIISAIALWAMLLLLADVIEAILR